MSHLFDHKLLLILSCKNTASSPPQKKPSYGTLKNINYTKWRNYNKVDQSQTRSN